MSNVCYRALVMQTAKSAFSGAKNGYFESLLRHCPEVLVKLLYAHHGPIAHNCHGMESATKQIFHFEPSQSCRLLELGHSGFGAHDPGCNRGSFPQIPGKPLGTLQLLSTDTHTHPKSHSSFSEHRDTAFSVRAIAPIHSLTSS